MNDEEMERAFEEARNRAGVIDPGLYLAVSILDELERRFPGFDQAVRGHMEEHAKRMENHGEDGDAERAKSIRDWIAALFDRA